MKARDLMVRTVASVRVGDTLARAATLMREHDRGAVVVLEPRAVVAAMLTDRDICMAALRSGKPLGDLRVEHTMSRELYTCGPEDDVGRTLGDIVRPHLAGIGTDAEPAAPRESSA